MEEKGEDPAAFGVTVNFKFHNWIRIAPTETTFDRALAAQSNVVSVVGTPGGGHSASDAGE